MEAQHLLFLEKYFSIITGSLRGYGDHVTANNCTNNKVVFFSASDFKIVYYNNN